MATVQEIREAMECLAGYKHNCGTCAFNPVPGRAWQYGCVKGQNDIVEAARKALEGTDGHEDHTAG